MFIFVKLMNCCFGRSSGMKRFTSFVLSRAATHSSMHMLWVWRMFLQLGFALRYLPPLWCCIQLLVCPYKNPGDKQKIHGSCWIKGISNSCTLPAHFPSFIWVNFSVDVCMVAYLLVLTCDWFQGVVGIIVQDGFVVTIYSNWQWAGFMGHYQVEANNGVHQTIGSNIVD